MLGAGCWVLVKDWFFPSTYGGVHMDAAPLAGSAGISLHVNDGRLGVNAEPPVVSVKPLRAAAERFRGGAKPFRGGAEWPEISLFT